MTRYKNDYIQHNSIEFFLHVLKHHLFCLHVGGYDRQILNEASALLQRENSYLSTPGHLT